MIFSRLRFVLSLSLVFAMPARAEYRAYLLGITNTQTGATRQVLSTLDDRQYSGYHQVHPTERVAIIDHWMCRKRSDYDVPICENPHAPGANGAASTGGRH